LPQAAGGFALKQLEAFPPDLQPPAAEGFAPSPPVAFGGWSLHSQTPVTPPSLRNPGYATG